MKLLATGDLACLIELDDNAAVHAVSERLHRDLGDRAEELVPGHQTLLVRWRPGTDIRAEIEQSLARFSAPSGAQAAEALNEVHIPVVYDGPDLAEVAALTGVSPDELPGLHCAGSYTAAFIGFSPGFAYLIGGDERLRVPRRSTPRTSVPAGAVAVAGGYSAIYPTAGPGGWQIIGHTTEALFDLNREPPALIAPGTHVQFEQV